MLADRRKNIIALSCTNVYQDFIVLDKGKTWKLLFTNRALKKINALKDISISVPKGKFVGILGRNGAGKSTLLRTLAGVYSPSSGYVEMNGPFSGLFELGGFGNRYITGREYARRILEIQGAKNISGLIEDIHDFSELKSSFDERIHTYSAGMTARLYFATATALPHDIYLVDEILSVGDEHFQAKSWQRLKERFATGASGVLVTHDWSAVLKLCDEAFVLSAGKIVHSGRPDKVVQSYLQIPRPDASIARFSARNPEAFIVHSREQAEIHIEIEIDQPMTVQFNYAIETLRRGIGWEILLLNPEWFDVSNQKGIYTLKLTIPSLPISPGRYFLNLFLRGQTADGTVILDTRSWTLGNPFELIVTGEEKNTPVNLPVTWHEQVG